MRVDFWRSRVRNPRPHEAPTNPLYPWHGEIRDDGEELVGDILPLRVYPYILNQRWEEDKEFIMSEVVATE